MKKTVQHKTKDFSVLICVYAGDSASYLHTALSSIAINQTILPTEIVLVIDGPIDSKLIEAIAAVQDQSAVPFKIIQEDENRGLAYALNCGLKHCSYEWVARMDADDISLPNRFEVAQNFINANPEIDIFGTQIVETDFNDNEPAAQQGKLRRVPLSHSEIRKQLKFRNPLNHPSVFFRAAIVRDEGGYPLHYPEDYFLWITLIRAGYRFANLPETSVYMRINEAFFERRGLDMFLGEARLYLMLWRHKEISLIRCISCCLIRALVRLCGKSIAKMTYRLSRRNVTITDNYHKP